MGDLRELYQELIIDHSRSPRNFGRLASANLTHEGFNPLCGDKIIIYVRCPFDIIEAIQFEGCGCAISMASASMMTEAFQGKDRVQVKALFTDFHALVTTGSESDKTIPVEKWAVLAGVSEFPMRVKCATLAWHTALAALKNEDKT